MKLKQFIAFMIPGYDPESLGGWEHALTAWDEKTDTSNVLSWETMEEARENVSKAFRTSHRDCYRSQIVDLNTGQIIEEKYNLR